MKTETITPEIKKAINKFCWVDEEGNLRMSLSNARLDFKKNYYVDKITKKTIKLYWINGNKKVFVYAKVEYNKNYGNYAIYAEDWSYIEHFGGKNDK